MWFVINTCFLWFICFLQFICFLWFICFISTMFICLISIGFICFRFISIMFICYISIGFICFWFIIIGLFVLLVLGLSVLSVSGFLELLDGLSGFISQLINLLFLNADDVVFIHFINTFFKVLCIVFNALISKCSFCFKSLIIYALF